MMSLRGNSAATSILTHHKSLNLEVRMNLLLDQDIALTTNSQEAEIPINIPTAGLEIPVVLVCSECTVSNRIV